MAVPAYRKCSRGSVVTDMPSISGEQMCKNIRLTK